MRPASSDDRATDLAIAVLLAIGAACWIGLVAAQLGRFHVLPVVLCGAFAFLAGLGLRAGRGQPRAAWWQALDGAAAFVLAAALYLPGYDATLYGSDAAVYLGGGVHLARTGTLAVEDSLLAQLPPIMQNALFPPFDLHPRSPLSRSPAGLAVARGSSLVYSTFSQLPSVWLGIGYALGGGPGARALTPLLAAGAMMAFYLFVRRRRGPLVGLLAAGLLAPAVPQLFFARLPMGESGAQFFLWSGLLAYGRWAETRALVPALAAGAGLGLAGLARPEYVAFVALGVALLWLMRAGSRPQVPGAAALVAAGLFAHAAALLLFVVPTHYRLSVSVLMRGPTLVGPRHWTLLVGATGVIGTMIAAVLVGRRAGLGGAALAVRAAVAGAVGLWAVQYAGLGVSPSFGSAVPWLRFYTGWPVLVLAAMGLPLLVRCWRSDAEGRLALVIAAVAAAHFLYDPHTAPMPVWAGRRLLPAVLPVLFAAAAALVVRLPRRLALAAGGVALVLGAVPARSVWSVPYFRGTSSAAADVAARLPADAVVLLDPSLAASTLDVALALVHGRDAVQLRGIAGDTGPIGQLMPLLPGRPVYLIRHGLLGTPMSPGVGFEAAGEASFRLLVPGVEVEANPGAPVHSLLSLKLFRAASSR